MKKFNKIWFYFVLGNVVIVFMVWLLWFVGIDPEMVSEWVFWVERIANNFYSSTSIKLHNFFMMWTFLGFFFGFLLHFYVWPVFYLITLFSTLFVVFSILTGDCYMLGLMFLYLLVGVSGVFYLQFCLFFHREWGLPVDKWRYVSHGVFKGLICGLEFLLIYNLASSLWVTLQGILAFLMLIIGLLFILFTLKSFTIISTLKCAAEPQLLLAVNWNEYFCVFPFIMLWISYLFFKVPLSAAMLGSLISIGPLASFFLITKFDKLLQIFLKIMTVLKARYTTVYILTLFLVGAVPCFHSIISVPFTPVLIFVIRLVNLLVMYDLQSYLLLKDLICCKTETVRKCGARAIQLGALAWAGGKLYPQVREVFEDIRQRAGDRADANHAMAAVENRFREGAITQTQREDATVSILDNLINRKGETTTKIKGTGFSSVTKIKSNK